MGDTEVKNRKVNRSKAKNAEQNKIPNPAIDPRDEVNSCHVILFLFSEDPSVILFAAFVMPNKGSCHIRRI